MNRTGGQPTGDAMRSRVRRATVGAVGAAVVASAVVTASLADAADNQGTTDATTTAATSPAITDDEDAGQAPAQPSTSALAAPTQVPSAGSGRRHASSGGS